MIKRNLITEDEIRTLEQIDKDCIRMHVCPPPKTFVSMEVQDGEGNIVDSFVMKSNSWVRNTYTWVVSQIMGLALNTTSYGAGYLSIKQTNDSVHNMGYWSLENPNGPSATSSWGTQVGTSTTAESFESTKLGSMIAHGISAGQLSYNADTNTTSYNAPTKKWTNARARIFNNNSGASITVNEVGIAYRAAATAQPFLVARDVLPSGITVPNAGQLTVTYTIEMTFPA